jgi:phage recombination protein Bet
MSSNAPAVYDATPRIEQANGRPAGLALTQEDLEVLRATVLAGATDAQLAMYARSCARHDLDPFTKEVYGFVNRDGGIELVVSIEGLRKRAETSGQYRGQTNQQWCGADGDWKDIWLDQKPPAAARITVHREGCEPFTGVALWREYGRTNHTNWSKYPTVMLSKCAEASAIRHLFPHQTAGLYISEEVALQQENRSAVAGAARDTPQRQGAGRVEVDVIDAETIPREPRQAPGAVEPGDEHEAGWRVWILQLKEQLGISTVEFNAMRRRLELPLVEKMDVSQMKQLRDEMINFERETNDPELDRDSA